ncbi:MFS transporter [Nocardia sp. BMG51109]|uniref:MFS transporter n=1 Tax=Nocardia sp. BMG51109 TaxID=1056816 RepID=UPI000464EBB2|nr:MFS transporter [Nocardia sp. BMG51109]
MTDVELDSSLRRGSGRRFALAVMLLGLFMVVLDGTVVGVSLPAIIHDLGLSFTQAQWVTSVYALVFAVLLITAGRLGDRYGGRIVFAAGVVLFVAGSLLAAAATDPATLIWGRIVQGIGAAGVLAGTLSTIDAAFRGRDRAIVLAAWGSVLSGTAVVGPLLGGWLTTSFTWPWIFLINLPLGLVVLAGIAAFVPETPVRAPARGWDVDGFLLSAAGFALVVFAVIEGQTYGWWKPLREFDFLGLHWSTRAASSPVPLLLLAGAVLLGLFVLWERHRAQVNRPVLVDLSLFADRTFRWENLTALAVALAQFGLLFTLPLFLVNGLGMSTLGAGFVLAVLALAAFAAGVVLVRPGLPLEPVWAARLGLAIETVAVAVTALFVTPDVSPWLLAVLSACYGVGLGLTSALLTGNVGAPPELSGQGPDTRFTARQVGSALGAAVVGGVLSISLGRMLPDRLAEVPGLPRPAADEVAVATRESAGDAITVLRDNNAPQPVVDALTSGFADATRIALFGAAIILLLGFLSATRIPLRPSASPAGNAEPSRTDSTTPDDTKSQISASDSTGTDSDSALGDTESPSDSSERTGSAVGLPGAGPESSSGAPESAGGTSGLPGAQPDSAGGAPDSPGDESGPSDGGSGGGGAEVPGVVPRPPSGGPAAPGSGSGRVPGRRFLNRVLRRPRGGR